MAIYHLNAKIISRGKGQSAIAAAAYRSGERLRDEQTGEQKHYSGRAERIRFSDIMAPRDAPEWAHDRNQLWNQADRAEKRKDAQLAREIEISLPHELTDQQREWLVKDFAREAFVRKGYAVDIAIHAPDKDRDGRNHHAHLMVTMRTLGPEGFAAKKDRSQNSAEQLGQWRAQWAHLVNRHLQRHGHAARVDHRSLKEQGIEREATIHLGYAAQEIDRRGGQSNRMEGLQAILARNEIRLNLKGLGAEMEARELAEAEPVRKARRVAGGATGVASGVVDFQPGFFVGVSVTPEPRQLDQLDRKDFAADPAALRQAEEAKIALENILRDVEAGADLAKPVREPQEQIRAEANDRATPIIEDARQRAGRHWQGDGCGENAPATCDRAGAKRAANSQALATWRAVARSVTVPPDDQPRPRKRTKSGGDSTSVAPLTVAGIVADYLALCQNPLQDLPRWLAEDKKKPAGTGRVFQQATTREGTNVSDTTHTGVANAHGLRRQSLPPLRGGLDAHRERGRGSDRVLARPRASAGRYDQLRSVCGEAATGAAAGATTGTAARVTAGLTAPRGDGGADLSFRDARADILARYAARIDAARRTLPAREISAALRALVEERRAAVRAIEEREQAARTAAHERRAAERFSARLARQSATQAEARLG